MRRFAAEVIFTNPDDVPNVRAVLAEADCELVLDNGTGALMGVPAPVASGEITGTTKLAEGAVSWWLEDLTRTAISRGHFMFVNRRFDADGCEVWP